MNGHSLNDILSKINEIVVSSGIEYNLYDIARLFYKNVFYFCNACTLDFTLSKYLCNIHIDIHINTQKNHVEK